MTAAAVGPTTMMPTFFHVGPPRTGTTWLYHALLDHVSLPVPRFEETWFFDRRYSRGINWYLTCFQYIPDRPVGEICPTYFASAIARERIALLCPGSKIACTFRDPVPRLYSLYRVLRRNGTVNSPFERAIHEDGELLETSRYAFYLKAWLHRFGERNVLITFYGDLISDPRAYVESFCKFIGVEPPDPARIPVRKIESSEAFGVPRFRWLNRVAAVARETLVDRKLGCVVKLFRRLGVRRFLDKGSFPALDSAAEARLRAELEPEVEALERLLGCDLSHWKRRETARGSSHALVGMRRSASSGL